MIMQTLVKSAYIECVKSCYCVTKIQIISRKKEKYFMHNVGITKSLKHNTGSLILKISLLYFQRLMQKIREI